MCWNLLSSQILTSIVICGQFSYRFDWSTPPSPPSDHRAFGQIEWTENGQMKNVDSFSSFFVHFLFWFFLLNFIKFVIKIEWTLSFTQKTKLHYVCFSLSLSISVSIACSVSLPLFMFLFFLLVILHACTHIWKMKCRTKFVCILMMMMLLLDSASRVCFFFWGFVVGVLWHICIRVLIILVIVLSFACLRLWFEFFVLRLFQSVN